MKEVVVISGKGGTGKTSLLAYYALNTEGAVTADCDVDAPNLHLLLRPKLTQMEEYTGTKVAVIDGRSCNGCGECIEACRFEALRRSPGKGPVKAEVVESKCEGCALCSHLCPRDAITMEDRVTGELYLSRTAAGVMVHALLRPGQENSGKLVAMVKHKARSTAELEGRDLILVDGPPGIGCPVISALSGADMAVVVTEPTTSGLSDLVRVLDLAQGFKIPACIVVNKSDLNDDMTETIVGVAEDRGVEVIGSVPYDEALATAIAKGSEDELLRLRSPATEVMKASRKRMLELLAATGEDDG